MIPLPPALSFCHPQHRARAQDPASEGRRPGEKASERVRGDSDVRLKGGNLAESGYR